MGEADHYKTLGLWRDASKAQVKEAFSRLALLHHPDRHVKADAATRRFRQAYDAYHVLYDDSRRAEYDLRTSPAWGGFGYGGGKSRSSSASTSTSSGYGYGVAAASPPPPPPPPGAASASPAPPRPRVAMGMAGPPPPPGIQVATGTGTAAIRSGLLRPRGKAKVWGFG